MIFSTSETIPGREIKEVLGLVKGSTIRAKHIGKDIMAGFKTLVGGEIKGYTEMLNEARDEAMTRMEQEAKKLNADAIIAIRLGTSGIMQGAAEVLAYGTAVKLKK